MAAVARRVTFLGSPPCLGSVALVACGLLALRRRVREAAAIALAYLGIVALHAGVVRLVDRARPAGPHLTAAAGASFPSGHASESAALYGMLLLTALRFRGRRRRRPVAATVLLLVAIGLSRVVLGVHYPSDVLGGWILAAGWLAAVQAAAYSAR